MNADLLKRCKVKASEELAENREILLVDLHGFDIVQTSPRFAVFERDKDNFKFIGGSDVESAARFLYDKSRLAHREKKYKRY